MLPFKMTYKLLMVIVEVGICIIPASVHLIIQLGLVYCWVFLFVVMREVYIGLRPDNVLHINMVDYTFLPKAPPKIYTKGCASIFDTSKSSLLFLSKHSITTTSKHSTTSSTKYSTASLYNHTTILNLLLSRLKFYSNVCTIFSCKPPSYTILRLFT